MRARCTAHVFVRDLGDMDEPGLAAVKVYEGPEVGDAGDDAVGVTANEVARSRRR